MKRKVIPAFQLRSFIFLDSRKGDVFEAISHNKKFYYVHVNRLKYLFFKTPEDTATIFKVMKELDIEVEIVSEYTFDGDKLVIKDGICTLQSIK